VPYFASKHVAIFPDNAASAALDKARRIAQPPRQTQPLGLESPGEA
jgi:hypothetical protein